jgi:hypothetical protein
MRIRTILTSLIAFLALSCTSAYASVVLNGKVINPAPITIVQGSGYLSSTNPIPMASAVQAVAPFNGSITGTATSVTITPPADANLRDIHIDITDNATLATAGVDTITATLNGVVIYSGGAFVPATALDTNGVLRSIDVNFGSIAPNAGSGTLVVTIGTALATGSVYVNAYFD